MKKKAPFPKPERYQTLFEVDKTTSKATKSSHSVSLNWGRMLSALSLAERSLAIAQQTAHGILENDDVEILVKAHQEISGLEYKAWLLQQEAWKKLA